MRHDQIGMMSNDEAQSIALKGVNVEVTLAGLMAETHLEQRYCNETGSNLEIAYTFPLPVGGVLLHFEIELNGKRHTGQVVARTEAEKQYEAAIEKGDAAFRLQKLRDGLFSASLGNIKVGEEVIVRLVWVETLTWNGNAMRYRLPTTLAPRYGTPTIQPWQRPVADAIVEYPLTLKMNLLGDLARGKFDCPTHHVSFSVIEEGVEIVLNDAAFMDRDFILELHPQGVESIGLVASYESQHVVALNFLPPAENSEEGGTGRNFVMVLDCSGSMAGDSIDQAKEGVRLALMRLTAEDSFAVIGFGSTYQCFHEVLLPANRKNINLAHEFVKNLPDMGGTELMTALEAALGYSSSKDDGVVLPVDVLLLTDGEAWGMESIATEAKVAGHRIFTVGIGSAVAEDVVRSLADTTGGACELVTPNENMAQRIERHFLRMRQPRISSIELDYGQPIDWETRPQQAVFAGDSITLFAAMSGALPASVQAVLHLANGQQRMASVQLHPANALGEAIMRIGAQGRLQTLDSSERMAWAVRYQLVSDETDYFITVEREANEKADASPELQVIPQMMAAGWGGASSVRYSRGPRVLANVSEVCCSPSAPDYSHLDVPAIMRCSPRRASIVDLGDDLPFPVQEVARKISKQRMVNDTVVMFEMLIKKLNKLAGSFILASLPKSLDEIARHGAPPEFMDMALRLMGEGHSERDVLYAFLQALANRHCGKSLSDKFRALLSANTRAVASTELQAIFERAFDEYLNDASGNVELPPSRYDIPAFLRTQVD